MIEIKFKQTPWKVGHKDNFLTVRYQCVLAYIFPALKLRIEQLFGISIYEDFLIIL